MQYHAGSVAQRLRYSKSISNISSTRHGAVRQRGCGRSFLSCIRVHLGESTAALRIAPHRFGTYPIPGRVTSTPTPSRHPSTRSTSASPGSHHRLHRRDGGLTPACTPAGTRAAAPAAAPARRCDDKGADQPISAETRRLTRTTDSPTLRLARLERLSFRNGSGACSVVSLEYRVK
jgi:hypothetical protein